MNADKPAEEYPLFTSASCNKHPTAGRAIPAPEHKQRRHTTPSKLKGEAASTIAGSVAGLNSCQIGQVLAAAVSCGRCMRHHQEDKGCRDPPPTLPIHKHIHTQHIYTQKPSCNGTAVGFDTKSSQAVPSPTTTRNTSRNNCLPCRAPQPPPRQSFACNSSGSCHNSTNTW